MMRWSAALALAGSILLALPPNVSARCAGSGATFRCDPDSLLRKSQGLPPRVTPRSSYSYEYEGNTFSLPGGASVHRYTYKSPSGRTYHGKVETFPGGSYRHRGSWR